MASLKPEVAIARQLFLFGAGDGVRITNAQKLAAKAGIHVNTVQNHMSKWLLESEELVSRTCENSLALKLSGESMIAHDRDMLALRGQIDQVKWELETLDEVTSKLEMWVEKFSGDADDQEKALKILEAWQRNCGQKSSLRSQFLSLQKQWTSLAGITDLKEIQITREKTMAVGRAKQKLKAEETEASVPMPVARGGIFARPVREITETGAEG